MSACSPDLMPVIAALAQRHAIRAIIRPVRGRDPEGPSRLAELCARPGPMVQGKIAQLWGRVVRRRLQRALRSPSDATREPAVDVPVVDVPCWQVNAAATAALIDGYAPHLMVVFGAPILASAIHALPVRGSINVHLGIAPHYRGAHTLFWPLLRGDADGVGITIHRIEDGVDTGEVLVQGFPEIRRGDGEAEVWARSILLAARLLPDAVGAEMAREGRLVPAPGSPPRGECFRHRDRTPLTDFAYLLRRASGRARLAPRPERVVWHATAAGDP